MEQTLVLILFNPGGRCVGRWLKTFEDMSLSLEGLMFTCVGNEFAEKFCEGEKVAPPEDVAFHPVFVMLLEGHEAISRVYQCLIGRRTYYSSDSAESARKDIKLWFGDDFCQVNWLEEIERQDIAMWYPDGQLKMSKRLESSIPKGIEVENYLWAPEKEYSQLIFIRIESDAVLNGRVGNIIAVLEMHFLLRGLRLADKDEAFAKSTDLSVSPSSGLVKDCGTVVKDCGTVVITVWEGDHDEVQKLIKVKDEYKDVKMDADDFSTEINSVRDFIYISPSAKDIIDWFPSGMILRPIRPRYLIFPP